MRTQGIPDLYRAGLFPRVMANNRLKPHIPARLIRCPFLYGHTQDKELGIGAAGTRRAPPRHELMSEGIDAPPLVLCSIGAASVPRIPA